VKLTKLIVAAVLAIGLSQGAGAGTLRYTFATTLNGAPSAFVYDSSSGSFTSLELPPNENWTYENFRTQPQGFAYDSRFLSAMYGIPAGSIFNVYLEAGKDLADMRPDENYHLSVAVFSPWYTSLNQEGWLGVSSVSSVPIPSTLGLLGLGVAGLGLTRRASRSSVV
jgi:hypothetical protein